MTDIRELAPGAEIFDAGPGSVSGFGARRRQTEAVSYILMYRTADGKQRRFTIGRHGSPWTPTTARDKAKELLGEVAKGGDPAADKQVRNRAETVSDLCDLYLAEVRDGSLITRRRTPKKASTLLSDQGRIDNHIRPILGAMKVAAVTSRDVETLMRAVAKGKTASRTKTGRKRGLSNVRGGTGAASRTVGLLGAIFTYAVRKGLRTDNPVHGVLRPKDGERRRRLTDKEYAAFGAALRQASEAGVWPPAVAAARFLAATEWRSGEALALRWTDLNLERRTAVLPDTKTGRSIRPLASTACDILRTQRTAGDLVFPSTRGQGHMSGFRSIWERVAKLGALPSDITPHVLRHSFASLAHDLGLSEPTIGALIGHAGHTTTARYIHAADDVLIAAADKVAARTEELINIASVVPSAEETCKGS